VGHVPHTEHVTVAGPCAYAAGLELGIDGCLRGPGPGRCRPHWWCRGFGIRASQ
jgi:hypothetical protein